MGVLAEKVRGEEKRVGGELGCGVRLTFDLSEFLPFKSMVRVSLLGKSRGIGDLELRVVEFRNLGWKYCIRAGALHGFTTLVCLGVRFLRHRLSNACKLLWGFRCLGL